MEHTTTLQELLEYINQAGNETSRAYENMMTDAVSKRDLIQSKNEEKNIIQERLALIYKTLEDTNQDENIRYACFVMATIYNRRNKNKTKFKRLLDSYPEFCNHKSYNHYYLLYYVDHGYCSEWKSILERAEDNARIMNNAGARHMFAEFVAMFYEEDETKPKCDDDVKLKEMYLREALKNVDIALKEQDYAKFYATKGRILALQEHYEEAIHNINTAIDKEDSNRKDYAIRIGNYLAARIRIQEVKNIKTLEEKMNDSQKRVEDNAAKSIKQQNAILIKVTNESEEVKQSLTRNLEYLGIFAGIISFTMGSISLAGSMNTTSAAAGLILVLFGSLCGTYLIFDIIIHSFHKEKLSQYLITGLLTAIVLIGGLFLCFVS